MSAAGSGAQAERDAACKSLDVLTRKVRFLEGELQQATKGNDTLHTQLLVLEKERNGLSVALTDARKELECAPHALARTQFPPLKGDLLPSTCPTCFHTDRLNLT